MRSAWVYFQKEMREMARSYKLAWIPVVFIILGIMQPLVTYYMPEILGASGDVPPALLETYEMPGAAVTMAEALGQYGTIGLLVLVLAAMNSLSGERYSGTAELVQVRPISPMAIIFAKWSAYLTLLALCLGLGAAAAAYYTEQLIGVLSWNNVLSATGLYGLWLLCIVSLTLLFSACLRGPVAAFMALLSGAGLTLFNSLLPLWMDWTPASLQGLSAVLLTEGSASIGTALVGPLLSAGVLIVFCIAGAALSIKRNKLAN
ncbi:ABC transporter permease subunit [Paenibacillus sp. BR2-3]|uniref:ABC transporter permease n=1 Tax=Paenibacillus sp. BR2-3 TaxID=3048494 RepID=UPI003977BC33